MKKKPYINIEVDRLTNSIVNVIDDEIFKTSFEKANKKTIYAT
jgi:hypothetical protein